MLKEILNLFVQKFKCLIKYIEFKFVSGAEKYAISRF